MVIFVPSRMLETKGWGPRGSGAPCLFLTFLSYTTDRSYLLIVIGDELEHNFEGRRKKGINWL